MEGGRWEMVLLNQGFHTPRNLIFSSSGEKKLLGWQGRQVFLCWVRSRGTGREKPIVVHMHAHAHCGVYTCSSQAGVPKKAGVYLDPSALLVKNLLIAGDNKSLAPRRCST